MAPALAQTNSPLVRKSFHLLPQRPKITAGHRIKLILTLAKECSKTVCCRNSACIPYCHAASVLFYYCEILKHIGYTISMSVEMHIDVNQHLGTSPLYHSLRRSRKHGSVTTWVPALRHTGGSGAAKRSAAFRYVEDLEGSAVELQRRS